ncbi:MAG: SUMF1/EgtB/PvdO family nonheme iron enzyme [Myxococcales bacterium]|nr:SUMF1/EgtB/PvdO family nonheme iron enzyme [Myxococcales bacterium]
MGAVVDPWLALAAFLVELAGGPPLTSLDPGPSAACPDDMRLVDGTHYDSMYHLCLDTRPGEKKRKHCFGYAEGVSLLEGPETPVRVCMDQFEWPNRRGAEPAVLESFESADKQCRKVGKRMCSEQEWELACEGPRHQPLAYGWSVNVKLCNSGKEWRPVDFAAFDGARDRARRETRKLWQGAKSGSYATCVSPFGVYDLTGNVEEWVATRPGRKFPGALMGGFWAKPWTGCRGTNDAHQPGFAFYETGFRCCKDPAPATRAAAGPGR